MKYTPKPQNRKTTVAAIVLIATSLVLFFLGGQYYTKGRGAVQALGVLCLAFATFFIVKRLTVYTYTVYPKDRDTEKSVSELGPDELELIISKKSGARDVNRAMFDLEYLTKAEDLPSSLAEAKKLIRGEGKMDLYYYTVTVTPSESLLLVFERDGVKNGAVLEVDRDLRGFFIEIARINSNK